MKLDPIIHIAMHSVLSLKPGVTITLQDVAMILGLPLDGNAVIGMIQTDGWRDMVEHTLGFNHLRE